VVTDGVTEAMNARGELYGAARLRAALERIGAAAPGHMIAEVTADVGRFVGGAEPSDDLTLLCVRWHGGTGAILTGEQEEEDFEISER
jgi:adenylate cyclase